MFKTYLGECGPDLCGAETHVTQALTHRTDDIDNCLQAQGFVSAIAESKQKKERQKCEHNPLNPRFFEHPGRHKQKSIFFNRALFRLKRSYWEPYEFLVHLLLLNPTYRKKNSQRREAITLVLMLLVYYTDIDSMEIKIPQKGRAGWIGLSMEKIAKMSGLTIGRVKNAFTDLKQAGYLVVGKRINISKLKEEGKFRSVNSYKKLTDLFWSHLGIRKEEIKKERDYKKAKLRRVPIEQIHMHIKAIQSKAKKVVKQVKTSMQKFTEKIPRHILDAVAFKTYGYSL